MYSREYDSGNTTGPRGGVFFLVKYFTDNNSFLHANSASTFSSGKECGHGTTTTSRPVKENCWIPLGREVGLDCRARMRPSAARSPQSALDSTPLGNNSRGKECSYRSRTPLCGLLHGRTCEPKSCLSGLTTTRPHSLGSRRVYP